MPLFASKQDKARKARQKVLDRHQDTVDILTKEVFDFLGRAKIASYHHPFSDPVWQQYFEEANRLQKVVELAGDDFAYLMFDDGWIPTQIRNYLCEAAQKTASQKIPQA